ncbi:hypothetical protein QBC46DRAFT_446577 [Diplogelasinospora grovesii]|uniref:Uncharacterized protein n=1 Tax=Diplogelasinospora grovesii TaxID=303347 RepID=A0AAN6NDL6_9PEZI|nr:hypothetical protein QBC46DRAFT_446577 [Diplogelasinospora grovesii]
MSDPAMNNRVNHDADKPMDLPTMDDRGIRGESQAPAPTTRCANDGPNATPKTLDRDPFIKSSPFSIPPPKAEANRGVKQEPHDGEGGGCRGLKKVNDGKIAVFCFLKLAYSHVHLSTSSSSSFQPLYAAADGYKDFISAIFYEAKGEAVG